MPKNTLYVTGFTRESKAVDLAPEFEKYVSWFYDGLTSPATQWCSFLYSACIFIEKERFWSNGLFS